MKAKCIISQIHSVISYSFQGQRVSVLYVLFWECVKLSEISKDYQCTFSFLVPCADSHSHQELGGVS